METLKLRQGHFYLLLLVLAGALGFVEYGGMVKPRGALLTTLVFWTMLIQGCVALAAVTELIGARWIASLRRELLAACPLQLLVIVLYLLMLPQLGLYPWTEEPGRWLNPSFFIGRSLVLLVLCYWAGRRFARASLAGSEAKKPWAVTYLALFVTTQSLVGFDWVMSLEYPWYSSLFGAYFFVEALYCGIALSALLFLFVHRSREGRDPDRARRHLGDVGTLLFGFSVLWVGLFFTQYLLLWYGNLPEEVGFILRRISTAPFLALCWLLIVASFLVPFTVLISRRAKGHPAVLGAVAATVLAGQLMEKLLFILPVVPLHFGSLVTQFVLVAGTWLLTVHSSEWLLPASDSQ
ncbi:hypothetical protein DESUT3_03530 [Desulfuromonas versatilis]|uniref:Quinol:cytochrome c oxidoreductase quinone-binding subunit 2 n=1 Tax=Desulfuromonas versatilis TaxID=2802975 RepID=A0ABN6DTQ8_9BACT|nr:hypothetical protein [Desulfuromonas versatilis]BCR03284.1 hypothetical protein DESUT3_03530 [Desulfuromonas versatilis]